jgi:hypothetical protein
MEAKNALYEAAFSPLNRSFTDHEENQVLTTNCQLWRETIFVLWMI